ncbi:MAG: hypothetical protein HY234_07090 [Acidobacteria bacterium]|nr:hypothetical protein [Acidobacteriota bacterium]
MEFWMGPWWIFVILFAIGLIIWAIRRQSRKRAQEMAAAGSQLGLASGAAQKTFLKSLSKKKTHLFSRGSGRKIRLWLEGKYQGLDVRYFDYQYTFGGLHAAITYVQGVAAFAVPNQPLPVFQLRPATSVEKLASKLGYPTLKFNSHASFTSTYLLQGPEETSIRMLFLPPLLDFFQNLPESKWSVESSGEWLFVYAHASLPGGAGLAAFLDEASRIARAVLQART